jgi:putative DNA primase/helicase
VLDIKRKELRDYSPDDAFSWQLPYSFDPDAMCPKIEAWLNEAMQGEVDFVNILVAFARATVVGRADLGVFLEAVGPGGTGKSTFLRLLMALVGARNTVQTDLKSLEGRFETARVFGKRLVLMPDEISNNNNASVLQKLTGRDHLRYERKGKDAAEDFIYEGMVVIATNQQPEFRDRTSGLGRRRITVPFNHRPEKRRRLIDFQGEHPVGEFSEELAGFLNLALAMSSAEMRHYLKEFGESSEVATRMHRETLLATCNVAAWVEERFVFAPGAVSRFGKVSTGDPYERDEENKRRLYPDYEAFCKEAGLKPDGMNKFSTRLQDLIVSELGHQDIVFDRDRKGSYVLNARLRIDGFDNQVPTFITESGGVVDEITDEFLNELVQPDELRDELDCLVTDL